jgi:hypothetical protein
MGNRGIGEERAAAAARGEEGGEERVGEGRGAERREWGVRCMMYKRRA